MCNSIVFIDSSSVPCCIKLTINGKLDSDGNFHRNLDADWLWCLVSMVVTIESKVTIHSKFMQQGQYVWHIWDQFQILDDENERRLVQIRDHKLPEALAAPPPPPPTYHYHSTHHPLIKHHNNVLVCLLTECTIMHFAPVVVVILVVSIDFSLHCAGHVFRSWWR